MSNPAPPLGTRGFTLLELVVVLAVMGLVAAMGVPPLQRMRERAAIQNGRHMVTSALSLASVSASKWGATAVLDIDPIRDELRVWVDTGSTRWAADTLAVRTFDLRDDLGVQLTSNRDALCFNSRGVGVAGWHCGEKGGWIAVSIAQSTDTIRINSVGRVRR